MMNDLSISTSPPPTTYIVFVVNVASPPGKVISYCSRFRSTLLLDTQTCIKTIINFLFCQ